jgi:hypothetical protein
MTEQQSKPTPHKHADLMREWALDTSRVVQYAASPLGEWHDCAEWPTWGEYLHYRFKPEPEPDYGLYCAIFSNAVELSFTDKPNIKLTFCGETHQLKAAEVLK